jgi:uncharacterized membrane protein required for colicin V production
MNFFDWIIALLLGWGGYKGFKKGLMGSLSGVLSWGSGILAAFRYYHNFADYLQLKLGLASKLGSFVAKVLPLPSIASEADRVSAGLAAMAINEMALPDFIKRGLLNNAEQLIVGGLHEIGSLPELISLGLAEMLLRALAFVLLLLIVGALVKAAVYLVSTLLGFTPLYPINSVLGLCLGLIVYAIGFVAVLMVLSPVIAIAAMQGNSVASMIESSFFFTHLLSFLGA